MYGLQQIQQPTTAIVLQLVTGKTYFDISQYSDV